MKGQPQFYPARRHSTSNAHVIPEVLVALSVKNAAFCDVMPCGYRIFQTNPLQRVATHHSETSGNFHENMASEDSIIFRPTQSADTHDVK